MDSAARSPADPMPADAEWEVGPAQIAVEALISRFFEDAEDRGPLSGIADWLGEQDAAHVGSLLDDWARELAVPRTGEGSVVRRLVQRAQETWEVWRTVRDEAVAEVARNVCAMSNPQLLELAGDVDAELRLRGLR